MLLCLMDFRSSSSLLSSSSRDIASNLLGVVQLFELVDYLGHHPCCRVPISFCRLGLLLAALVEGICSIVDAVDIAIVTASAFNITIIRSPFELQLLVLQFLALPLPFTRLGCSQLVGSLVRY